MGKDLPRLGSTGNVYNGVKQGSNNLAQHGSGSQTRIAIDSVPEHTP